MNIFSKGIFLFGDGHCQAFEFVLAFLDKEIAHKNDTAMSKDNWLISSSKLPHLFHTVSLVTHFRQSFISVSHRTTLCCHKSLATLTSGMTTLVPVSLNVRG